MRNVDKKSLAFVLHHYQEGRLDTRAALARLQRQQQLQRQQRLSARSPIRRWAAAAAVAVAIAAGAVTAGYFAVSSSRRPAPPSAPTVVSGSTADTLAARPAAFHFDNTPLPEVLHVLSDYYGVELAASDTDKRLTGDLDTLSLDRNVRIIEQVLGVSITIRQPEP